MDVRSSSRNICFKPKSFHFTHRPLFPCGSFENDFDLFQGEGYERSLGMICSASSFFPRGIECPPLVLPPPDSRSGSGAV